MKGRRFCANGTSRCIRSAPTSSEGVADMSKKQKPQVRKPTKKIADAKRVRFGASWAPRKVRFGASWAPAGLRK
jgi:hypothetical protein